MLQTWLAEESRSPASVPATADNEEPAPEPHPELQFRSAPGPDYSAALAREHLANRYENLLRMTTITRHRLREDTGFLDLYETLRGEGWLDWHVVGAVFSICTTYREVELSDRALDGEIAIQLDDEDQGAPAVPLERFTEDALRTAHGHNNFSTLVKTWGRPFHGQRIDIDAIGKVLRTRYRHYKDDISHEPPFNLG